MCEGAAHVARLRRKGVRKGALDWVGSLCAEERMSHAVCGRGIAYDAPPLCWT
jgi:hypothetical protein